MGQKFMQYTNFLSGYEINFLGAIGNGRITTMPIQNANTLELDDFCTGDADSLFTSFDLDAAIQKLNQRRAVLSPPSGEPTNANSTANSDSIQSDTTSSPPAAKGLKVIVQDKLCTIERRVKSEDYAVVLNGAAITNHYWAETPSCMYSSRYFYLWHATRQFDSYHDSSKSAASMESK
jgi:hypothetical protein